MTGESRSQPPVPPRLATWLAGLRLPAGDREFQLGDLAEEFSAIVVPDRGVRAARRWYWRQALRCLFTRRPPAGASVVPTPAFRPGAALGAVGRDIGYAFRLMRRTPVVSTAAVLTFALGIGANAAIFSVARPVLVDALPFPDEDELTAVWLTYRTGSGGLARNTVSPGDYGAMRAAGSFESIAAYGFSPFEMNLTGRGAPQQVAVGSVTANFFATLGVQPIAGRLLGPSDIGTGAVAISESLWHASLNSDPAIVGRTIRLDGRACDVAGVVPDAAGLGTHAADVWFLFDLEEDIRGRRRAYYLQVIGRLLDGVTRESANAELALIMDRLAEQYPDSNGSPRLGAQAVSFREELTGPVRPALLILVGGALTVLLIAGINLAGLQIARQSARHHELAVRRAVGASRGRLVGLLMTESLTLAVLGGAAGLVCASLTLSLLRQLAPSGALYDIPQRPTPSVALFAAGLAIATGLGIGLLPALRGAAISIALAIRSRLSIGDLKRSRSQVVVLGAQMTLTCVLLIVATLVGVSLSRVLRVDPGFALDGMLVADFTLPRERYDSVRAAAQFYAELIERLEAVPGVTRACVADHVPLDDRRTGSMTWVAEGDPDGRRIGSVPKVVSGGCFETLGVPVRSGELFEAGRGEPVVVVSESMAKALWPDEPRYGALVGRRIHMGLTTGRLFTIVGVVGDIRNGTLESSYGRQVWVPHSTGYGAPRHLVVRTAVPPAQVAAPVRQVLADLDDQLALANIRTMGDIVSAATASRRFVLVLLGGFGVISLLLSAVGIYGVLADFVGHRTSEIGLRMALGASAGDVARLVAGRVALAVLAGTMIGLAVALALSTYVASILYDSSATDARVYAAVAAFVIVVALAAAWPPMRRAVRIDPLRALRME